MPKTKVSAKNASKRGRRADKGKSTGADGASPRRPVWAGTLAFGLVTLPVDLYPATRASRASLRMIDASGTPLRRRYTGQDSDDLLKDADIVRGYPVGDERFVTIEDAELEALDPVRSRTIDLESFVPETEIDPTLIESSYVLVPDADAITAYRLLVTSMAEAGRAGIATFVMRGKAYVVAILSREGTLRALTLRYHDEVRTPADIGLPDIETADVQEVDRLERAMKKLEDEALDTVALADEASRRLKQLAAAKLKKGADVHEISQGEAESDPDGPVVDVMELLRRSLGQVAKA